VYQRIKTNLGLQENTLLAATSMLLERSEPPSQEIVCDCGKPGTKLGSSPGSQTYLAFAALALRGITTV
jgi:hypothetical protein